MKVMKSALPKAIVLACLFMSVCLGQIEVKTTSAYSIEGVSNTQTVGGLLVSSTAPTKVVPVGIIDVTTDAANLAVTATDSTRAPIELVELGKNQFLWKVPGKVDFLVEVVDFDKRIWAKKVVSAQIPDAKPIDPKPDPTPNPDEKLENLSVLMVYESAKLPSYPAQIAATINSTELRNWARSNNVPVRSLDQNTQINPPDLYAKWLAMPSDKLPRVIVGNERKVAFIGEIKSVDDIKSIVLKWKAVK
jgi:hypothetical protein